MNDLAYLGMSIIFLPIWLLIFLKRPDQRPLMLKIGIVAGFLSMVAQFFWYYRDYWHPPVLFGKSWLSLEDYLFGFLITGIAVGTYNFVFKKKNVEGFKAKKKEFLLIFIFGLGFLIFFTNVMGYNSVVVSSLGFLVCSGIVMFSRRDLIRPSLFSGVLMLGILVVMYIILFSILYVDFWDKYWLLTGSKFDIKLINIPLTEYLWFFSIGTLLGGAYEYFKGYKKADFKEN